jgi:hypothetical protein
MPPNLLNVVNTPQDLFEVLRNIHKEDIRLSETNELVIRMQMFTIKR